MADYSDSEAYVLRSTFVYRPERYYYPNGNNPKTYFTDVGNGRPALPWQNSQSGRAVNNPYLLGCFQQPPITWMESAPYDPQRGKFIDTFFYKNHIFAPGSN